MRSSIQRPKVAAFALMLGLAACGTDDSHDKYAPVDCSKVADEVETFVAGLDHPGDKHIYDFKLVSADPVPPARFANTWVVQVNRMDAGVVGAPVEGATIKVTPWMPEHDHGTGVAVDVSPMTEPGQYELTPIYMAMNAIWEITVRATVDTSTDLTVFKFCIP